jgi:holliday junction DNA helicase RuvB
MSRLRRDERKSRREEWMLHNHPHRQGHWGQSRRLPSLDTLTIAELHRKHSQAALRSTADDALAALQARTADLVAQLAPAAASAPTLQPITGRESSNPLRPHSLDEVVGQAALKPLLRRLIATARGTGRPLDHMLLVGASGTGKTTLATVIASEIGTRTFALKAPVDTATLMALRASARDRDVVFVDEIHMQVSGDRRGITQACDPESFYALLEDGVLSTPSGPLAFPRVTWIGATTDVGLLPEPLSNRFVIQPRLAAYTLADMTQIAARNADALRLRCAPGVAECFAGASRGVPRQANSYLRAARQLTQGDWVDVALACEVVQDLFATTLDGLTESMQIVLRFLYTHGRRETRQGIVYSASVNTLATACGHGRDTKAISLLVEPYLLHRGLLEVRPSGRTLTPAGVARARDLLTR